MTGSKTHMQRNSTRASNKAYTIDWNQIQELPDDCVSICLSYKEKYALLVQCKYLSWNTRYENLPPGTDIAAFSSAIETALMSECECIDCEYLTNCLQPLFDQITDALAVMQRQLNRIEYGYEDRPGNQLPPDKLNGNMAGGSNPTCDLDILWAQCIQLIGMTNEFITDVLERIESSTNTIDAAEVIGNLPFIDEFGGDAVQSYVQLLNEGIAESYAAQYTVTLRDEMACALFCLCKDDCTISIERINRIFVDYLKDEFGDAPSLFANIGALMSYLLDGSIESDIVVYAMYMLWWGVVGVGGSLAGLEQSNYTLAVILQLAADDPSDDWQVLCTDCPEPWQYNTDFADEGANGWVIGAATGTGGAGGILVPGAGVVSENVSGSQNAFVVFELVEEFTGTVTCQITYDLHMALSGGFFADALNASGVRCGDATFPDQTQGDGLIQSVTFDVFMATKVRINMNGVWSGSATNVILIAADWSGMPDPNPFTGL